MRLACVGSIKDDILNMEELSLWLIDHLRENLSGNSHRKISDHRAGNFCGSPGADCKSQRMPEKAGRTGIMQKQHFFCLTISVPVSWDGLPWSG